MMLRSPILLTLTAVATMAADDIPRGQIIDRILTAEDAHQSYALFLPSAYSPDRSWPILYCLDPMARGRVPVERFSQAAEKAGFIVVGSNNSRNGPIEPVRDAIRAMIDDTHARFAIDNDRVYAAGFSGGARVALNWALGGSIAGVIACGASFGPEVPTRVPFKIVATAGVDDFNYDELYRMSRELAKRGDPHLFIEFDGGHDWLSTAMATQALDFFVGRIGPHPATASNDEEKAETRLLRVMHDFDNAVESDKGRILRGLQKDAARPEDSPDRRIARRVVSGLYVRSIETSRDLMAQHNYREAAGNCEIAVLAAPANAFAWYSLAVAQSAAGNTRRALEALEKAVASGYNDRAAIEREPLLERVRGDRRYKALLEDLK